MPAATNPLDGLLVVDKPGKTAPRDLPTHLPSDAPTGLPTNSGPSTERLWTSHDVVARVRRLSGQRRIGHTGTLDPMASGVLVLCLGNATRLVEYYQGEDKRYAAEIRLGRATDTYDAEGSVTATAPVPLLERADITRALEGFLGEVWQTPPVFSAIKQEGEALYARARRGEAVTVEARKVKFHQIELLAFDAPDRLELAISCSAGVYIRSLAHDLGLRLGTLATLSALRREAAGDFTLADAHSLAEIETAATHGNLTDLLRAPGDGLPLPQTFLSPELCRRLGQGQRVPIDLSICPAPPAASLPLVQVRDEEGRLQGIMRCLDTPDLLSDPARTALWKAEKWLS